MSQQLVVNVTSFETRVASVTNGLVTDLHIERHRDRGIIGNIYLGKVQRVLPGMQAAFIEIGLDKAAFLYVGDIVPPDAPEDDHEQHEQHEHHEPRHDGDGEDAEPAPKPSGAQNQSSGSVKKGKRTPSKERKIEELLKQGQDVLVQVTKDSIGSKGPRVSCNISLPGRHLVYMPTHQHVGISRRITNDEERARLRTTLEEIRAAVVGEDGKPTPGGFVVRTVSEGLSREKLQADVEFLAQLWRDVDARQKVLSAPALVQPELDVVMRTARDLFTSDVDKLIIDDEKTHQQVHRFVGLLDDALQARVQRYVQAEPIFEHFGIETEIARAMSRRVWLKSGGYLVIDQAEALTAVDVNTGKFVGKRTLEDTILRTNLEACAEVAYQLRLRNIGGMVIIDFIDMELEVHREKVLSTLTEALSGDRARCNVVKMSELGLVEMTRQRTRESMGRLLSETCWYCEGRGVIRSKRTVAYDIMRTILRQVLQLHEPVVVVQTHPEVADLMNGDERDTLLNIAALAGKRILVRPRGSYHQEQFDIFGAADA
jgi:ribonuclease G